MQTALKQTVMIVGRENERKELLELLEKDESQFCAVYGRRRVGKTYLIRETFENQFAFYHTGIANVGRKEQLAEFRESLRRAGLKRCKMPKTWFDAFHYLSDLLKKSSAEKKVVFIDELPWMDTPKSQFVSALEHFWNGWANMRNDIVLIVCGSATSWIVKKIMRNHGGLYGRLTRQIHLPPFNLYECEQYAHLQGLELTRKELAEAYMIFGGIPYYWSLLRRGESLAQNIDRLCFADSGRLSDEFDALYASLFKNPAPYIDVVTTLSTKKIGMTRKELLKGAGLTDNPVFNRVLEELQLCGFIRKYQSMQKRERDALFQLMDNFTLFYFQYFRNNSRHDAHFWTNSLSTGLHNTWAGLAFERVCLWHLPQIKQALGVSGVVSYVQSWRTEANSEHSGAQVDLLIDRNDGIINLCEMKFASDEFVIDKAEDDFLRRRKTVFQMVTKTRKAVHTTMITTYGLARNAYRNNIQSEIVLNDLFANVR